MERLCISYNVRVKVVGGKRSDGYWAVIRQKIYARDICHVFVFSSASSLEKSSMEPVMSAVFPNARL